jgi:hypothetical protein
MFAPHPFSASTNDDTAYLCPEYVIRTPGRHAPGSRPTSSHGRTVGNRQQVYRSHGGLMPCFAYSSDCNNRL